MALEHSGERSSQTDRGERCVTSVFYLLGVGVLLPWNAFISAKPYFQARMCDGDGVGGGSQYDVELWFGLVFNTASVSALGIVLLSRYIRDDRRTKRRELQGTELPTDEDERTEPIADALTQSEQLVEADSSYICKSHGFLMVNLPLAVFLTVFLLTTLFVLVPSVPSTKFLRLTLIGLALCGMSCAIAGAGITATAGMFSNKVGINAYFSGQAVGGVAVSVANLLAATLEDPDKFWNEQCQEKRMVQESDQSNDISCVPYNHVDWSTFAYFSIGCLILGACIVGYTYIERSDDATNLREQERIRRNVVQPPEDSDLIEGSFKLGIELQQNRLQEHSGAQGLESEQNQQMISTEGSLKLYQTPATRDDRASNEDENAEISVTSVASYPVQEETTLSVLEAVKSPALAIFLTFFVTLAIFPSWTSRLESAKKCHSHYRLHNDLFMPMTFVVFNIGDLSGRLLSARVQVDRIQNLSRKVVLGALARFLFGPLFLLCLATGSAFNQIAVRLDVFSLLVQFLFAVTNGMAVSISFMHAPSLIPSDARVQETSATLLNFCLMLGLLSGALFSFPFSSIATAHW